MDFLPEKINQYTEQHTQPEAEVLQQLVRETWLEVLMPRMLSGHIQGEFLRMIVRMLKPKRILEIGTYTGYSAISMAMGMESGAMLHTIDKNSELETRIRKYLKLANVEDKVTLHIGDATKIISSLNEKWDLVFIDADKENYSRYFDLVIDNVNSGGFIVADNVLWSGKVLDEKKDDETKAIDDYNKKVLADNRVENLLLPVRDGLMICRKCPT